MVANSNIRVVVEGPPDRPPGRVAGSGTLWWMSTPDDERGWRRAEWAVVETAPASFVIWVRTHDGESGMLMNLPGADEATALDIAQGAVRQNDLEHLRSARK